MRKTARSPCEDHTIGVISTGAEKPGKKATSFSSCGVAPFLIRSSESASPYHGSAPCRFLTGVCNLIKAIDVTHRIATTVEHHGGHGLLLAQLLDFMR